MAESLGVNDLEAREKGLRIFGELLGDARADALAAATEGGFGTRFSGYAADFVFARVWGESSLSRRELSLLTLGALVALGRGEGIANYVAIARASGLSDREIEDAITHLSVYAGFPAANAAMTVARDVLTKKEGDA